jgi:hypothetical protein
MVVTMVEQLRNVDIDRAQIDDVLGLLAFAKLLRTEHEQRMGVVPEWIDDKVRVMSRYVEMHRRDALELRLKQAKAQAATLLTTAERREKVEAEIAALEAELAGTKA